MEFITLTIVSIVTIILIVRFVLKTREHNPLLKFKNIFLLVFLEITCMIIGKYGANINLYWWIYYSIPLLLTVFVPTIYFKMNRSEVTKYLSLTFLSAPIIHILFSFFFGWKNYMPFIKIPSIWEI